MTDVINNSTIKRQPASSFSVEESPRAASNKLVTARTAVCCCFISALFITIHNGIRFGEIAVMRMDRTHSSKGGSFRPNITKWEMMEPNGVYEHWKERRSVKALHVIDEMAGVIGYATVIPAISFIAPALSRNIPGSLVSVAIPAMAFASGLRVMEWTVNMGIRTGSDWMSTWAIMVPNDARTATGDVQFIQVLEMIYQIPNLKTLFFSLQTIFSSVSPCGSLVELQFQLIRFRNDMHILGASFVCSAFCIFSLTYYDLQVGELYDSSHTNATPSWGDTVSNMDGMAWLFSERYSDK